ncbi:hypothetical protein SSS_00849 [Sarcoptes scabiei]|uniref:Uncharacterized protein n=1 Tax=Sarcoptes scabiei TaxID=52283 RepID=A0A834VJ57_SARSC|nr:hypothetical protein SSS_00849 [Sarcoptes scabiei]
MIELFRWLMALIWLLLLHCRFHHIDSHSVLNSDEWQLRYHQSSWLHKEFLIRDRKKSKSIDRNDAIVTVKNSDPINQSDSKENIYDGDDVGVDFDDEDVHHHQQPQQTSSTSSFSDMVTKSTSSNDYCDDENGCSRCFQPSTHCERKMNDRFWSIRMDPSLSVDELLAISPIETSMKEENRRTMKFQQCHALNDSIIDEMCQNDRRSIRKELLQNLHLRSCRRFLVKRSLNNHLYSLVINTTDCSRILKELLMLDNLVEELACEYESILHRYDCKAKWSVVWTCRDCKLAYRDWLCSVIIPYHLNGKLIKPCQTVCEQVQQKCPHIHPYGKGQYAGEPVFLCVGN